MPGAFEKLMLAVLSRLTLLLYPLGSLIFTTAFPNGSSLSDFTVIVNVPVSSFSEITTVPSAVPTFPARSYTSSFNL